MNSINNSPLKEDNQTLMKENSEKKNISNETNCSSFSNFNLLPSITHDLKNPLFAIISLSDILRSELAEENFSDSDFASMKKMLMETRSGLGDIASVAEDMLSLVQDLLDVSAVSSGIVSVDLSKEIDVKDLILRSVRVNKDFAMRMGVSLRGEVEEDVSFARLDMRRMKQVLANFISNSIKYSPKKTTIVVSAKNVMIEGAKHLQIVVKDQGFGMTKEQLEKAFEKYQTIANPNSDKVDSFGLGLPLAKELIERQEGKLIAQSVPMEGTRMEMVFRV